MHSKNQKRHGSPCPSRAPLVPMKPKVSVAPSPGDTLAFRVPRDYPHSRFSKAPLAVYPPKGARGKTCVSLPVVSLEKMPCLGRAEAGAHIRVSCSTSAPSSSSSSSSSSSPSSLKPSPTPPVPQRSQEKQVNGRGPRTPRPSASPSSLDGRPSPARSPLDKRPCSTPSPSPSPLDPRPAASPSPSPSPLDKKQQNGTRSSRPQKRLSGRVFDPNKHCGVEDPESKRQCTRSLTCKTHSLTHRRAVPGRRKHFDILLAEHKGRAKEKDGVKEKQRDAGAGRKESQGPSAPPQDTTPPSKLSPLLHNGRTISTLKLRLANAHIPRVPGGGGGAAMLSSAPVAPPPSASDPGASWVRVGGGDGRLSSDEGDAEPQDYPDTPTGHCSPHHPRPLGCCAFSSRLMGRGHYVFDRRWDRMRLALHYMVERHVNAQMWRKVPLAAESLRPSPGTLTTPHPPSPSTLPSPLLSSPSVPLSSPDGFSLVSYSAAFPRSPAGVAVFNIRSGQPLVSAPGRPRNCTVKPGRPPGEGDSGRARKRKAASSLAGADAPHQRNGGGCHAPTAPPGLGGRKKAPGRGASGLVARGEDWYPCPDPAVPYPHARDPGLPPASPLAYGGGVEGRRRRSPSSCRGKAGKTTKAAGLEGIFRRSSGGLLASGPESPPQPKMHH